MAIVRLDSTDRKILRALQSNGRMTNANLAESIGLSPAPCLRRVRSLTRQGIIQGYVAKLDQAAVGLPISVFVQVTLEQQIEHNLDAFEEEIVRSPEVMECYLMTGDADYYLRVVVPDLPAYERFLKRHLTKIPGVANIKSSFALKQVHQRSELPI